MKRGGGGGEGRSGGGGKLVEAEIFEIMWFLYFGLECAQNTLKVLLKSLCKTLDYRLIFGVDTLTAERQGVALPVSSCQLLCGQTRCLMIDTILSCSCYYSNMCIADLHSAFVSTLALQQTLYVSAILQDLWGSINLNC